MILIQRIAALFSVLLLAACAGNPVSQKTHPAELAGKAVIVFSVSHDLQAGNGSKALVHMNLGDIGQRATLSSIDDTLGIPHANEFKTRRGHVYVLEVEPGWHQFDSWQVAATGGGYRLFPKSEPKPLQFEVRKGQAVYLGNLHAHLQLGRNVFGLPVTNNAAIVLLNQAQEDIPLAEAKVPSLRGKIEIRLLKQGPWSEPLSTL